MFESRQLDFFFFPLEDVQEGFVEVMNWMSERLHQHAA